VSTSLLDQYFPSSRKVYIQGSRPDIRVPMREILLTPTTGRFGSRPNEPVRVYDTSGPYTDPSFVWDPQKGIPPLRRAWILERGDVEEYEGRPVQPLDDGYTDAAEWRKLRGIGNEPGTQHNREVEHGTQETPHGRGIRHGRRKPKWAFTSGAKRTGGAAPAVAGEARKARHPDALREAG